MEKLLIKSRIDCPPPESHQLLKEKDLIIQKQYEKLKLFEFKLINLGKERDCLLNLINNFLFSLNNNESTSDGNNNNIELIKNNLSQNSTSQQIDDIKLTNEDYLNHIKSQFENAIK